MLTVKKIAKPIIFYLLTEANPEKFNSRLKNKMFYAGVRSQAALVKLVYSLLGRVHVRVCPRASTVHVCVDVHVHMYVQCAQT